MGTTIRPELSKKNLYWIEKHRYYELKHFCLQYPIWKRAYLALEGFSKRPANLELHSSSGSQESPTERCAITRVFYAERMGMVERTALRTNQELSDYILQGVTLGLSYDSLKARLEIPCCKDTYYSLYRRFFWLLNDERR
jgi:hypothetical protein